MSRTPSQPGYQTPAHEQYSRGPSYYDPAATPSNVNPEFSIYRTLSEKSSCKILAQCSLFFFCYFLKNVMVLMIGAICSWVEMAFWKACCSICDAITSHLWLNIVYCLCIWPPYSSGYLPCSLHYLHLFFVNIMYNIFYIYLAKKVTKAYNQDQYLNKKPPTYFKK